MCSRRVISSIFQKTYMNKNVFAIYFKFREIYIFQFSVPVFSSALVLRHEPITRFVTNEIFDGMRLCCQLKIYIITKCFQFQIDIPKFY